MKARNKIPTHLVSQLHSLTAEIVQGERPSGAQGLHHGGHVVCSAVCVISAKGRPVQMAEVSNGHVGQHFEVSRLDELILAIQRAGRKDQPVDGDACVGSQLAVISRPLAGNAHSLLHIQRGDELVQGVAEELCALFLPAVLVFAPRHLQSYGLEERSHLLPLADRAVGQKAVRHAAGKGHSPVADITIDARGRLGERPNWRVAAALAVGMS